MFQQPQPYVLRAFVSMARIELAKAEAQLAEAAPPQHRALKELIGKIEIEIQNMKRDIEEL